MCDPFNPEVFKCKADSIYCKRLVIQYKRIRVLPNPPKMGKLEVPLSILSTTFLTADVRCR